MKYAVYSIVVPVFRSEDSLSELYERINETFEQIEGDYELVFVDDCGGGRSWQILKDLRKRDKRVKIVRLTKNFGQQNALMCGFSFASGDYVLTMDDDLQNPPEEIPKLINAITASDVDVVYGVPAGRKHSTVRNLGSSIFFSLVSPSAKGVRKAVITNFRIAKKNIIEELLRIPTPNPAVGLLILKITENIGTVEVAHHRRCNGKSTYNLPKLVSRFANGVLFHSTFPLKMVFFVAMICLVACLGLCVYYLISFLLGRITISGWTTLVLLILFFSGIIMFSLGIVVEYLLRIVQEVRHMPQYVIRDKEV